MSINADHQCRLILIINADQDWSSMLQMVLTGLLSNNEVMRGSILLNEGRCWGIPLGNVVTLQSTQKESIHFCRAKYSKLRESRWNFKRMDQLNGGWHTPYFSSSPPGLWVLGFAASVYFLLVETSTANNFLAKCVQNICGRISPTTGRTVKYDTPMYLCFTRKPFFWLHSESDQYFSVKESRATLACLYIT